MRNTHIRPWVSAVVLILLAFMGVEASADAHWPLTSDDYSEAHAQFCGGGDLSGTPAQNAACRAGRVTVCQDTGLGCADDFPQSQGTHLSTTPPTADQCERIASQASTCCNSQDGSECGPLLSDPPISLAPTEHSLPGSADVQSSNLNTLGIKFAEASGICRARKMECFNACSPQGANKSDTMRSCAGLKDKFAAQAIRNFSGSLASTGDKAKAASTAAGSGSSGSMGSALSAVAPILGQLLQAEMQQQQTPTNQQQTAAACDCSTPATVCPNTPCPAAATAAPTAFAKNTSNDGLNSAKSSGNMNPGNLADNVGATAPLGGAPVDAKASMGASIPGGGGGMPAGGGSGGGATLGSAGGGGGANLRPGIGEKMTVGTFSPGGGSASAAGSTGGSGGGWTGYGHDGGGESSHMDLSAFLPGGRNDPTRKLAGGDARLMQIQSKDVNIWSRISDHIKARCSQGLLRDCVP